MRLLKLINCVTFFIILVVNYTVASPHNHVHTPYSGWFPGAWAKLGGIRTPTLTNQCPGSPSTTHNHSGASGNDIAAVWWPNIGAYSVTNSTTLNTHRGNMMNAGIKAAVIGYGPGSEPTLANYNTIADGLSSEELRIAFGIRPYAARTPASATQDMLDLLGIVETPKRYRVTFKTFPDPNETGARPVFYINRPSANGFTASSWAPYFAPGASFRENNNFIAFGSELTTVEVMAGGFDGDTNYNPYYDHTASWFDNKSDDAWGSNDPANDPNWDPSENYMFSAGVAPGYNTSRTKLDPCRVRCQSGTCSDGKSSYKQQLLNARAARPHFIKITSFNEWNEGSQIEPAKTNAGDAMSGITVGSGKPDSGYQYIGYKGDTQNYPNLYLDITDNNIGAGTWSPRVSFPVQ